MRRSDRDALSVAASSGRNVCWINCDTPTMPDDNHDKAARSLRIIALATNDWHGPWMGNHLLTRLGRRHRVLFSNGQWFTWDRQSPDYRAAPLVGRFETSNNVTIDLPGRLALRVPRFPAIDHLSRKLAAHRWRSRLRPHHDEPLALWVFDPIYEPYVGSVRANYLVYYPYDLYSSTPGWSRELEAAEMRLVRRADLVIATSDVIAQHLSAAGKREVYVVPNGVNFERFAAARDAPQPPDMAAIPHPRIGYIGSVNLKLDFDLLQLLATRRREWQWVIIGQEIALGAADLDKWRRLQQLPNVHALGPRPAEDIARYTAALDVGLLCYRTAGGWTQGIYPLRLHEHLAAGLAVISADFPAVRAFPDVVRCATSVDEWEDAIGAAVAGDGPGTLRQRQAVARANTWEERVTVLETLMSRCGATSGVSMMATGHGIRVIRPPDASLRT